MLPGHLRSSNHVQRGKDPVADLGHGEEIITKLVKEHLGIPPDELEQVVGERKVLVSLLRFLCVNKYTTAFRQTLNKTAIYKSGMMI